MKSAEYDRRSEMGMILHCGGRLATFEEIAAIDLPMQTETYRPVPNGDLVRLVEEEVKHRIGLTKPDRTFGLSKDDQQMFGTLRYDLREAEALNESFMDVDEGARQQFRFVIALRNSYDKTTSVGVCGGASVAVCDNLAVFHGSSFTIRMPHTKHIWDNLVPQVIIRLQESSTDYVKVVELMRRLQESHLTMDEKFGLIGVARGRGILTTSQMKECFKEMWATQKEEDHDFHQHRSNAFGLYQNFTQALKLGVDMPKRKIDRYTGVSALFQEKVLN